MTPSAKSSSAVTRVGALAVLGLVLSACGGSSSSTSAGATPGATASDASAAAASTAQLSGAALDKAFLSGMVTHHAVAVDMAKAELASGRNPQVKALAQKVIDAQTKEISTMSRIASTSYSFTPSPAPATPMGQMMGVPMTTDMTTMAEMVKSASDPDTMFLKMMIPHHASAISMADEERKNGANGELKTLAGSIVADQAKEIGQMQAMLSAG